MRIIAAVVVVAVGRVALAQPGAAEPATARPIAHDRCNVGPYLEPSLLVGGVSTGEVLDRIALGVVVRNCDDAGRARLHVRLGVTAYVSEHSDGAGFEAEVSRRIADDLWLGLRLGRETVSEAVVGSGDMLSFGPRLHMKDAVYVELDALAVTGDNLSGSKYFEVGVLGGIGFEGTPGAVIGGVEAGVAVILIGMVAVALSHPGE
ncbi:MAG TPA: hypothetical protein VMJ10_02440 [Kofleriaceae bacterium]|nr:hypothetical protein [Kofleriaceae bacterium]